MSIYSATLTRCVEEQEAGRCAAYDAQYYIEHGLFGRAAQCQRDAALHHEQARMRLERLIGVN